MKYLTILFVSIVLLSSCGSEEQETLVFNTVKKGDSLFVTSEYIDIYKKGRIEYKYYGARDKFAPKDTIDFFRINSFSLGEEGNYFINNRTSFIGFAIGIDSTISNPASMDNDKWISLQVDQNIIDWYNSKQKYTKWNNGDFYPHGKESIGDSFLYVKASEVILDNNDQNFRPK